MNKYINDKGLLKLVDKIKETNVKEYADSPIGTILPYGGSTAPKGYLICDGKAYSRTDYADLFKVIGTAFGAGDGSTTFNVPDMRESVPKGAGLTGKSSTHYDADGVAVGEFIDDRIKSHNHTFTGKAVTSGAMSANESHRHNVLAYTGSSSGIANLYPRSVVGSNMGLSNSNGYVDTVTFQQDASHPAKSYLSNTSVAHTHSVTAAGTISNTGSATTEVKSVGVNYIIKAESTSVPIEEAVVSYVEDVIYSYSREIIDIGNYLAGTINYYVHKQGKMCILDLQPLQNLTPETTVTIGTIPNGFRPRSDMAARNMVVTTSGDKILVTVGSTGDLTAYAYGACTGGNLRGHLMWFTD